MVPVQLYRHVVLHDGALDMVRDIELPCQPFPGLVLFGVRFSEFDPWDDTVESVAWDHEAQSWFVDLGVDRYQEVGDDYFWKREEVIDGIYKDWHPYEPPGAERGKRPKIKRRPRGEKRGKRTSS